MIFFRQNSKTEAKAQMNDKSFFGFLFKHLEIMLLIGMFALIASIYYTFVEYISTSSTFIAEEKARFNFATRLILGLMFVEVLLALATSYFRGQKEWFKSVLVTAGALVIAYYNHLTIIELFADFSQKMPHGSDAVKTKMLLANWFIFGLGEVIGLLMHSKKENENETLEEKILGKLNALQSPFLSQNETSNLNTHVSQNTVIAESENSIGFSQNKPKTSAKRGKSIDYKKMHGLLEKGIKTKDIATVLNCSEASVRKYKKQKFN